MNTKQKRKELLGIELMRGVAAFSVVLAHSGDRTWGEMSDAVAILRNIFSFHVPFFLAISFYFLSKKMLRSGEKLDTKTEMGVRFRRIATPYIIWSIIYLIFRSLFFLGQSQSQEIAKLYDDPISTVFLGGASYHLYFLPLLLTGTLTLYGLNHLVKKWSLAKIACVILIGISLRVIVLTTSNQFVLGPNIAFVNLFDQIGIDPYKNMLLRFLAVFAVWIITCLPFVGVALLFSFAELWIDKRDHQISSSSLHVASYIVLGTSVVVFFMATFLIANEPFLRPFQKLTVAFSLVATAITLSYTLIKQKNIFGEVAISLGQCSLGIYLIHPLVVRSVRLFISNLYPKVLDAVSISSVTTIACLSFVVSWMLVFAMSKNKFLNKYMV
ncbi:MAG: acyltransferase [Elainellaceae cyanobacterium]